MNPNDACEPISEASTGRKPRIALMGEFSAGKSTLTNLLLGRDPLPVRITATSVPPVWLSLGQDAAIRMRCDGTEEHLDPRDLAGAPLEDTRLVRLFMDAEILKLCDLLDMPGISDPNMSHDVWESVIDEADCVIWCSHATQAWRQSEASVWSEVIDRTNGNNILLITQIDKLASERDRSRVLARVRKETDGVFQAVFPISLTDALEAGDDEDAWNKSGAVDFIAHFVGILLDETAVLKGQQPGETEFEIEDDHPAEQPLRHQTDAFDEPPTQDAVAVSDETHISSSTPDAIAAPKVLPKRVAARSDAPARPRLQASEAHDLGASIRQEIHAYEPD